MKSLSFYEQQHLQQLLQQEGSIKYLFEQFVREVGPFLGRWSDHGGDRVWVRNAPVERAIEKSLSGLHDSLLNVITNASVQAWNRGNKKADDLVEGFIKDLSISDTLRDRLFSRNADALQSLLERRDSNGLNLSDRVWNITGGMKENLEFYLSSGLSAGRPAALIGQDVRQLLHEPNRRFHRVRNSEGELVLSQPMKEYHPGQGVYRSAYKNALRLTATQTNISYRQADHDRWQKMDFVLGIEIARSPSHRGPCPICDALVGKYPKGFLFTGFHPFCICMAVPIMMNHEEFADYLLDDTIPLDQIIKDIPANARNWVSDNQERAKGWAKEPYFIRDNNRFFGKLETNTYTPEEKKFVRARSTSVAMERAVDKLHILYPDIPNTELAAIHHYTKAGGNYRQLNRQLDKGELTEFNEASAELISRGLSKLPNFEGMVYRGTILKNKKFEELYFGDEVTHEIFTSASKDLDVALKHFMRTKNIRKNEKAVFLEIESKRGKDIESLSEFNGKLQSENQKEVLFDKKTRFKIVSRKEKQGVVYIKLLEL